LIKTRADLGKLGGLFKAALGFERKNELNPPELRRLLFEIGKLQRRLSETVSKI
jgi:hypothetical protein